ncbi:phosphotransferase enzyme family protein [Nocardia fluminea]|uniref:Phosphotransferase family enzyme n=1 Tax=Nocardia fluminea TaxID=134984 RepID=A0A2N3WXS2_9NOCA|nr:phosphotransferase [Nocardia fluminea]PKV98648.1 phosphotransferase family enzyme [Nocardia fluminea]
MSQSEIEQVALKACVTAGYEQPRLVPIKVAENGIYRLADQQVVVRVARPGQTEAASRELEVARWLQANEISAVQPAGSRADFVDVDGRPVTFWRELGSHRPGTEQEIATALRTLHALSVPEFLSTVEPFVRIDERIDAGSALTPGDRQWLRDQLSELRARWKELASGHPWGPIHGDAWAGNVVTTDAGVTTFLDLERVSVGPPEWDLTSTAIKHSSFGWIPEQRYELFWRAYGYDVKTWSGFTLLRDIRELRMTCMAVQAAGAKPEHAAQALHRLDCLRGRLGPRPWSGWEPIP